MSGRRDTVLVRGTGILGVGWGALLLTRGPQVWSRVAGSPPGEVDEMALRVLGARHLAQGAFQTLAPTHFQRLFVAVDVIHTATMLALAAVDPSRRRPALLTAAVAAASAATTSTVRASR